MGEANILADLEPLAVSVDDLDPLPGNPRRGDVEAVARSYAQFGQRKPIVARRENGRGVVLAGNHQLAAAKRLGWDRIAVVWTDDDDATAKAFALADNRTAELGDYDDTLLAALLRDVQAESDAALLAATGYDGDAIARLLAAAEVKPGIGDPDDAPAVPAAPVSKLGDLWLLGPHRVLCGDSTDPESYATLLEGRKVDLVWTDPPYGVAYVGGTKEALTIQNDALSAQHLEALLDASLGNAKAASRDGAVWFVASPANAAMFLAFAQSLTRLGIWRHTITWVKDAFALGRADYHYRHEHIFYGWTPGAAHQQPPDRIQDTVWEFPRPKRSAEHPTMKPVALIARAIANHTDAGDLVLDPFGGSGSTLIAANDLQRPSALIELDPAYVDVICHRYQNHTGEMPILAATGEPHDFTREAAAA